MIGIYLGAFKAMHQNYQVIYQDINGLRDIPGDMLKVDLSNYDYIIATPPCNYYSRANYRRETSEYSQKTKHLLPEIIDKLIKIGKPFIVENVRNNKIFKEKGLLNKNCNIYYVGRHTYWTNIYIPEIEKVKQKPLTDYKNGKKRYLSSQNLPRDKRQGSDEVHEIIEIWLKKIHNK